MTDNNYNRLHDELLTELQAKPVMLAKLKANQLTGTDEEKRETIEKHEEEIDPALQTKVKTFIEAMKQKNFSKRRIRRLVEQKFKITIV